jgi:iron complex transport system substrate-binding protein
MIVRTRITVAVILAISSLQLFSTSAHAATPHRIISLSPSATEDLFAIGAGNQVIAVDDLSNFPANAPMTALSAFTPNVEALVTYKPDLVILNSTATKAEDVRAQLTKLNIPVFWEVSPNSLPEAYAEIAALGKISGRTTSASEVVAGMKKRIDAAIKAHKRGQSVKIFHELDNTLYSATSETFIGSVYKSFGLTNIADAAASADSYGYPQLTNEYVIKANPRIIYLADAEYGESGKSVANRAGWKNLVAVRKNQVVSLPTDIPSRWGPRLADFYEFIGTSLKTVG